MTTLLTHGLSYLQYIAHCQEVAQDTNHAQQETYQRNLLRMDNVYTTFEPEQETIATLGTQDRQIWMVLAEGWCGDAACSVPIIAKISEVNPQIILRILRRDEHLDIMDNYLTNGGRSIPKVVAFAAENTELWQWGPRPAEAQNLVLDLKSKETPFPELVKQLLTWYDQDAGKSIETEVISCVITN